MVDANVGKLAHDLAKRFDEEAHARDMEISKLMRLVTEESDKRMEGDTKLGRQMTAVEENMHDETATRVRDDREIVQNVEQIRAAIKQEQGIRIRSEKEHAVVLLPQQLSCL